jgi:hypothetical protein
MSKHTIPNRTAADHLKQGVKQVKTTYNALYKKTGGVGGPAQNLKAIVKGKTGPGMPQIPAGVRAKAAAMGAASVTPIGPAVAFAAGVAKSVKATAAAKAAAKGPKAAPAQQKEFKLALKKPAAPAAKPAAPARPASPAPMNKPGTAKAAPARPGSAAPMNKPAKR